MSVPKRFGVLRLVGTLLKILAWIILIIAIIGAAVLSVGWDTIMSTVGANPAMAPLTNMGQAGGIAAGVGLLIGGLLYFLILFASGESLHLQLAVEENTRLTAALLLRMHQESHQDTRQGYGAGFANDPFER